MEREVVPADQAEDDEGERPARPRLSQAEANALMLMWNSMQGTGPTRARSWFDAKLWVPIIFGFLGTAAVQLIAYTQLGDRVVDFGRRLDIVEHLQIEAARERNILSANNGLQDERLQNFARALEQERQARADGEADTRRAAADQRSTVSEMARIVGEMRTELKVIVDRLQRHGELHQEFEHPGNRQALPAEAPTDRG